MFDRWRGVAGEGRASAGRDALRGPRRPTFEVMEGRKLLAASLAPLPASLPVPANLGYQLPLAGPAVGNQTYTVSSSNPDVGASIAKGQFLTFNVTHASSGAGDPAFTGPVTFQLFDDLTPLTTSRIEELVNSGFYTNKNFHRVANMFPGANDYIVQGGSVSGTGTGDVGLAGFPFTDEFVQQLAFTGSGQLAMANAGNDTNSSQFFITTGQPRFLDFKHTIFGQLVSGQQTLQEMTQVAKGSDGTTPASPILIASATLSNTNPNGVVHIDTSHATAGEASNLTITATDPATGTSTTQTVAVNVAANTQTERPFLNPLPTSLSVGQVSSGTPQTAIFKLNATAPTPGDQLTYGVGGGAGTTTSTPFTPIQNGTATVDANGVVTVTPNAGFTGVIPLLVGVRDQTDRVGTGASVNDIGNYNTQMISLNVTNGQVVNLQPIAVGGTTQATANTPTKVQLQGRTANPQSTSQTLTYTLVSQPAHGTVSNFNESTGTFTYTPQGNFTGNDAVSFRVTDSGAPGPNLTSDVATQTITVAGAQTGAVRQIGDVLVVTPQPGATSNTIAITQANGNIQVFVNGQIDATQPAESALSRIVVYGSKTSDTISVAPDVTVPATLNGGTGTGLNTISAGGGSSRLQGWYGNGNVLQGGPADDTLFGQAGKVKFVKSAGNDVYYAGKLTRRSDLHGIKFPGQAPRAVVRSHLGAPPKGTFYRFVNNRLVPTRSPFFPVAPRHIVVPTGGSGSSTTGGSSSGGGNGAGSGATT